ncbi:cobalamin biosynthesis protein [Nocardia sp. CDC153]|uniref:cobalamin biosynthesis protein n=1 Tax=Nocardia sp. CDC153 TaxID=3112167 RepID=UPI002DB7655A|nr:cobalamin biosynthesis protein [Nocardia sp. CDC153]MEC3954342.1 cobalamin biosynthesis protein [Nocardia sp. CDC153]
MPRLELVVGVGLRPGTPADEIVAAVREVLGDAIIRQLATIDRRADEPGFRTAAEHLGAEVVSVPVVDLQVVQVQNPSARVTAALGTSSVAEAAALSVSGEKELITPKTIVSGVVIAAAPFRNAE